MSRRGPKGQGTHAVSAPEVLGVRRVLLAPNGKGGGGLREKVREKETVSSWLWQLMIAESWEFPVLA